MTSFVEFMILFIIYFILSLRGDSMLDVEVDVIKGVMFINLEGELNYRTISKLDNELNYLL